LQNNNFLLLLLLFYKITIIIDYVYIKVHIHYYETQPKVQSWYIITWSCKV